MFFFHLEEQIAIYKYFLVLIVLYVDLEGSFPALSAGICFLVPPTGCKPNNVISAGEGDAPRDGVHHPAESVGSVAAD